MNGYGRTWMRAMGWVMGWTSPPPPPAKSAEGGSEGNAYCVVHCLCHILVLDQTIKGPRGRQGGTKYWDVEKRVGVSHGIDQVLFAPEETLPGRGVRTYLASLQQTDMTGWPREPLPSIALPLGDWAWGVGVWADRSKHVPSNVFWANDTADWPSRVGSAGCVDNLDGWNCEDYLIAGWDRSLPCDLIKCPKRHKQFVDHFEGGNPRSGRTTPPNQLELSPRKFEEHRIHSGGSQKAISAVRSGAGAHPGPMSRQPKYASFSMMTDLGQSR